MDYMVSGNLLEVVINHTFSYLVGYMKTKDFVVVCKIHWQMVEEGYCDMVKYAEVKDNKKF